MACQTSQCIHSLARLSLASAARPFVPALTRTASPAALGQARHASQAMKRRKAAPTKKKVVAKKDFRGLRLERIQQFSLCDALRYARAFEVGRPPNSVKYDLAVNLKGQRSGRTVKNRIKLPYPISSNVAIGVICKEGSVTARQAKEAGAIVVGEENIFEMVRNGEIPFAKLLCHTGSADALNAARIARILGPKGLMPNTRMRTIVDDPAAAIEDMAGAEEYREREGVLRMAVGKLTFTPEQVSANVKALVKKIRDDLDAISDLTQKDIHEVILSTTNGPGFSLNGGFAPSSEDFAAEQLRSVM